MAQKSRNYVFTFNNYDEDGFINITDIEAIGCKYVIVGFETGESGTEHLQGYIEFENARSIKAMKKIDKRIHWEIRRGTQEQAITYCKKDEEYIEFGTPSKQGKRTDLEDIRTMILEGETEENIILQARSWQAINGWQRLKAQLCRPRDDDIKPNVRWYHGDTGTGKTKRAREESNKNYDQCSYSNGFIIGYTGKQNVIFDDYRGEIPFNILLTMLDYGKCTINTKGGWTHFGATNIWITSSKTPEDCYTHVGENVKQLLRRIDTLTHFDTEV